MRKYIVVSLLAFFFIVGFFLRGPILSVGFQWYLKGYFESCLGGTLTYSDVHHENGVWIFDRLLVSSPENLEEGGYHLKADRAVITVSPLWMSRIIDLKIEVESPHLDIGKGGKVIRKVMENPRDEFIFFHVHTHFDVPQGSFYLHDCAVKNQSPIFFSILLTAHERRSGEISFWMDDEITDKEVLKIVLSEPEKSTLQLEANLDHFQASIVSQGLHCLWPQWQWVNLSQGTLSGNMKVIIPEDSLPYAKGKLVAENILGIIPNSKLALDFPTISIDLVAVELVQDGKTLMQTQGFIELEKGGEWFFLQNITPYWKLQAQKGELIFRVGESIDFSLDASLLTPTGTRALNLDGRFRLGKEDQSGVSVGMCLKGIEGRRDCSLHFSGRQLQQVKSQLTDPYLENLETESDGLDFVKVEIEGFGNDEFSILKQMMSHFYPGIEQVFLNDGFIDASTYVYFTRNGISRIVVDQFNAHDISFVVDSYESEGRDFDDRSVERLFSGGVAQASGDIFFDLSVERPLGSLQADLNIISGKLTLGDRMQWSFSDIDTHLAIRKGVLQKSIFKGAFGGLRGQVVLDENSPVSVALMEFEGQVIELLPVLPDMLAPPIVKKFSNDRLKIVATASQSVSGLIFEGKANISDPARGDDELIFGFALDKTLESSPLGFTINDGWFDAYNLRLEKYLSPFIFPLDNLSLSGNGDFQGSFNEHNLLVHYDATNLLLENDDFSVEINQLSEGLPSDEPFAGTQVFDFDRKTSQGVIHVHNAIYFEKNSGLLFTDVNTKINLEEGILHAFNLETFCNGIYFEGEGEVDWRAPGEGVFSVDMQIDKVEGKFSQFQHLFSHFKKPFFFVEAPLEGNVSLQEKGGYLHFDFELNDYQFQSHIAATLNDGILTSRMPDLAVQEISMNIEYDHVANILDFSDVQGTVLVGSSSHIEEYFLTSDRIYFSDYADNQSTFDIRIEDGKRDVIRIKGNTHSVENKDGPPSIAVELNSLSSHFGGVHPQIFELVVKDTLEIETFRLGFEFSFKELFRDLQSFSRTGLFFLSRSLIKELNDITDADGHFKADFRYDDALSVFTYYLVGDGIRLGSYQGDTFLLIGSKKGNLWTIDQLQFDEISLGLDLVKDPDIWKINFLGARVGNSILLGIDGRYHVEDARLSAKVNLFDADLSKFGEWPKMQQMIAEWRLGGQISATGDIQVNFDSKLPEGFHVETSMVGDIKNGKIEDIYFRDMEKISLKYTSEQGFSLGNIQTAVRFADENEWRLGLFLESGHLNYTNRELIVDHLRFLVPAEQLTWWSHHLEKNYPLLVSSAVASGIQGIKKNEDLEGGVRLAISPSQQEVTITLDDGVYQLIDQEHTLSNVMIDFRPWELNVSARYHHHQKNIHMQLHSVGPEFNYGELVLSDIPAQSFPLTLNWQINPVHGLFVDRIEGIVSGLNFNLSRDLSKGLSPDTLYFNGSVDIDMNRAIHLCEPQFAATLAQWKLGKGYSIQGDWQIVKDSGKSFQEGLFFNGYLRGQNFEFFDQMFYDLVGYISYSPKAIEVQRLTVTDPAVNGYIESIACVLQKDGSRRLVIPSLALSNLQPALLRPVNSPSFFTDKNLVIENLQIHDISGTVGQSASFVGKGWLSFSNQPKKNTQVSLFTIPSEILMRIGLDLSVLNPVKGYIEYRIKDGRVEFTNFKDVYSKGKMSQFYLSNSGQPSYVDFDGNLQVQVRMKQYNLLFKLAELFTVTVQGNLAKPTYTLQKQPK